MDLDINAVNSLFTNGGVFGTIIAVVMVLRFLWKTIGKDLIDRTKDGAEVNIINTMSSEIRRLNEEIQNIRVVYGGELSALRETHNSDLMGVREYHSKERQSLNAKLEILEHKFEMLRTKNEHLKASALQTYSLMNNVDLSDPVVAAEIKNRILALVFKEEKETQE